MPNSAAVSAMYSRIDCAVGEDFHILPRTELEAEGVHVGVRTDAGIAEQVPGAAQPLASLQHGDGLVRQRGLQVAGRADAGQAGTDDQDVEMWCVHGFLARLARLS